MKYEEIEKIVSGLTTTDIKGKKYIEVNERLKAFWTLCPYGRINTKIVSVENGVCVIQAEVYENKEDTQPRATGVAYEKEGSTFINKTSYIENCETSAVGRALGIAGFGLDTSVASADEVQNAINNQQEEKASEKQINLIENLGLDLAKVFEYYKIKDLKELTKNQASQIITSKMGKQ